MTKHDGSIVALAHVGFLQKKIFFCWNLEVCQGFEGYSTQWVKMKNGATTINNVCMIRSKANLKVY